MVTTTDIATTEDFMSVDRKAFKTAVSEALDGTKNSIVYSYMIACATLVVVKESNMIHCCGEGIISHTSLP